MPTPNRHIRRDMLKYGLIAAALWFVATSDTAMAQESVIAPIGEQFNSWIDTFDSLIFPAVVAGGLLLCVALGMLVSAKIGILGFCAVVAGAIAWNLHETITTLGG